MAQADLSKGTDPNSQVGGAPGDPPVNTEPDGRKYTANNAPPTPAQAAAGVQQGHYPDPNKQQHDKDAQDQAARDAAAKAAADAAAAKDLQRQRNAYEYGGYEGGAAGQAGYFNDLARGAQNRTGEHIDYSNALGSRSNALGDRQNALNDRERQLSIAEMMRRRASGQEPSIASMEADRQMGQMAAEQSSAAASARGPAAIALAQQGAAANTAAGQSNISNAAQINAAKERLAAEQAASGAYAGIRAGDYQGQSSDMQMQGLDAQEAQAQAQINAQQRAQNDAVSQAQYQNAIGINEFQSQAQQNRNAAEHGAWVQGQQLNQSQHDSGRADLGTALGIVGTGAGVLGAAGTMGLFGGGKGGNASMGGGTPANPNNTPTGGGNNPGSFDPSTGRPVSGAGGGYDPDNPNDPWSDIRLKEGIVREGHPLEQNARDATAGDRHPLESGNRVDAFLDGIHPLSYHYKDPAAEPRNQPTGGRYLGVAAQDLEAIPEVGPQMVSKGPRGKRIESGPTLSAALAGMGRLNERLKAVESGHGAQAHLASQNGAYLDAQNLKQRQHESGREDLKAGMQVAGVGTHTLANITSDINAKTDVEDEGLRRAQAKAWDEGHNAALERMQEMRRKTPDELAQLGAGGSKIANAVRGMKAEVYDEARGGPKSYREPLPATRVSPEDTARAEDYLRTSNPDLSRRYEQAKAEQAALAAERARHPLETAPAAAPPPSNSHPLESPPSGIIEDAKRRWARDVNYVKSAIYGGGR